MKIAKLINLMDQARIVARDSHDTKRQVGAMLVHKETKAVLSQGYNGYVRGAPDSQLPNGDDDRKHEYMRHAEENLISNAARHGVCVADCLVICTLSPCKRCLRFLWNSGIDTIYFPVESQYKDLEDSCNMGDINVHKIEINGTFVELNLSAKRKD